MNAATKAEKPKKSDWLAGHLVFLKGLKSPSEAQQLLLLLVVKKDLTPKEKATLDTLLAGEKAEEKAKAARAAVNVLLTTSRDDARRVRNHKLIELGLLFDFAGLDTLPRHALMGMLLEAKKVGANQLKFWTESGAEFLAIKDAKKAPSAAKSTPVPAPAVAPVAPVAKSAPDIRTEVVWLNVPIAEKDEAKSFGARWDKEKTKWYAPPGIDVSLLKKWLS